MLARANAALSELVPSGSDRSFAESAQAERSASSAQLAGDCRASKRSEGVAVNPQEHHVEVDAADALLQVVMSATRDSGARFAAAK